MLIRTSRILGPISSNSFERAQPYAAAFVVALLILAEKAKRVLQAQFGRLLHSCDIAPGPKTLFCTIWFHVATPFVRLEQFPFSYTGSTALHDASNGEKPRRLQACGSERRNGECSRRTDFTNWTAMKWGRPVETHDTAPAWGHDQSEK